MVGYIGNIDCVDVPRGKRVGGNLRQGQELVAIDRTGTILEIGRSIVSKLSREDRK